MPTCHVVPKGVKLEDRLPILVELWRSVYKQLEMGVGGLRHWFQLLGWTAGVPCPKEGCQTRGLSPGLDPKAPELETVPRVSPDPVPLKACGTQQMDHSQQTGGHTVALSQAVTFLSPSILWKCSHSQMPFYILIPFYAPAGRTQEGVCQNVNL